MSSHLGDLEVLVSACEEAFIGDLDQPVEGDDEASPFEDDEDVSHPPSGITFGMIRRARRELQNQPDDLERRLGRNSLNASRETTLIVMDGAPGEERKFWVTDPPAAVAKALEAGGFVPFQVMSGSGEVWVNSAKVRDLGVRLV